MKASSPRRRGNRGWIKVAVAPDKMAMVADQLRKCGSFGGEGDPVEAHAHFDTQDRLRRVHASYANGWRATLVIRADGTYSLSQAIKIVSEPKGAPL